MPLAEPELECLRIPEVFHGIHDVIQRSGSRPCACYGLAGRARGARLGSTALQAGSRRERWG
jgi:hypothetical protein